MGVQDRLDFVQRRAIELGIRSAQVQQESARLRAQSAELIARLTEIQQAIARILDQQAQQPGPRTRGAGLARKPSTAE